MSTAARSHTIEAVRKSVHVNAPPATAFDVFTAGLTRWWPIAMGIGPTPRAKVLLEPRLGGRWLEVADDGTETVVATVAVWDPPRRVVLTWHMSAQMKSDLNARSEVDVHFASDGGEGTQVELLHHKFESLGAEGGAVLRAGVNSGWPGLLDLFAARADIEAAAIANRK